MSLETDRRTARALAESGPAGPLVLPAPLLGKMIGASTKSRRKKRSWREAAQEIEQDDEEDEVGEDEMAEFLR
jgi:hypothetical protein